MDGTPAPGDLAPAITRAEDWPLTTTAPPIDEENSAQILAGLSRDVMALHNQVTNPGWAFHLPLVGSYWAPVLTFDPRLGPLSRCPEATRGLSVEEASLLIGRITDLQRSLDTTEDTQALRRQLGDISLTCRRHFSASQPVADFAQFARLSIEDFPGGAMLAWNDEHRCLDLRKGPKIKITSTQSGLILGKLRVLISKFQNQTDEINALSLATLIRIKSVTEHLAAAYVFNLRQNNTGMHGVLDRLFCLHDSMHKSIGSRFQQPLTEREFLAAFQGAGDATVRNYVDLTDLLISQLETMSEGIYPPGFWSDPRHAENLEFYLENIEDLKQVLSNSEPIRYKPSERSLTLLDVRSEQGLELYLHEDKQGKQRLWLLCHDKSGAATYLDPGVARAEHEVGSTVVTTRTVPAESAYWEMIRVLEANEKLQGISELDLVTVGYGFGGALAQMLGHRMAEAHPKKDCKTFGLGVPKFLAPSACQRIKDTPNYYGVNVEKFGDHALNQSRLSLAMELGSDGFHAFPLHDPVHMGLSESLKYNHDKHSYLQNLKEALKTPIRLYEMVRHIAEYRPWIDEAREILTRIESPEPVQLRYFDSAPAEPLRLESSHSPRRAPLLLSAGPMRILSPTADDSLHAPAFAEMRTLAAPIAVVVDMRPGPSEELEQTAVADHHEIPTVGVSRESEETSSQSSSPEESGTEKGTDTV